MLMVIFRRYSLYAAIFIALFWVAYVSLSLLSERSSYLGRLILETEAFADLPEFLGQTSTGTAVAAVLPAVVRVVAYRDEKLRAAAGGLSAPVPTAPAAGPVWPRQLPGA